MNAYYVYMLTNRSRVVLYTGITNSLERRLWFHENTPKRSFVKRYNVDRLVYYESFDRPSDAISREKEIKGWRREKKNEFGAEDESQVGRFKSAVVWRLWVKWSLWVTSVIKAPTARSLAV